jgi:hypothetical protein
LIARYQKEPAQNYEAEGSMQQWDLHDNR